jgi:hypothetical protein
MRDAYFRQMSIYLYDRRQLLDHLEWLGVRSDATDKIVDEIDRIDKKIKKMYPFYIAGIQHKKYKFNRKKIRNIV